MIPNPFLWYQHKLRSWHETEVAIIFYFFFPPYEVSLSIKASPIISLDCFHLLLLWEIRCCGEKKKIIFQGSCDIEDWSNGCLSYIWKGSFTQKWKFCQYLLTLVLFQPCETFVHLRVHVCVPSSFYSVSCLPVYHSLDPVSVCLIVVFPYPVHLITLLIIPLAPLFALVFKPRGLFFSSWYVLVHTMFVILFQSLQCFFSRFKFNKFNKSSYCI